MDNKKMKIECISLQDMTGDEILKRCNEMYLQISDAGNELKRLREICKHEKTFYGNYEYRIGATFPATICSYCGKVVSFQPQELNV